METLSTLHDHESISWPKTEIFKIHVTLNSSVWPNQVPIWHMFRQLSCRTVRQIVTWSNQCLSRSHTHHMFYFLFNLGLHGAWTKYMWYFNIPSVVWHSRNCNVPALYKIDWSGDIGHLQFSEDVCTIAMDAWIKGKVITVTSWFPKLRPVMRSVDFFFFF